MVTDKIKEIEATRAKLAKLEKTVAAELRKKLAALPAEFGFGSVKEFAKALAAAGRGRGRGPGRPANSGAKKRRRRAVITDATRAEVKKLVAQKKTGSQIAKSLGISLPSVQNIKKALGLVKARK